MEAIYILFAVIGVTAALSALFILVPLWMGARRRNLAPRPSTATLAYFVGTGFHDDRDSDDAKADGLSGPARLFAGRRPVFAAAVQRSGQLVERALAHWFSRRQDRRVFPALVAFLLLHALFSSAVLEQTLQFALAARLVVAVLLLSVLGFLMGVPFPRGFAG